MKNHQTEITMMKRRSSFVDNNARPMRRNSFIDHSASRGGVRRLPSADFVALASERRANLTRGASPSLAGSSASHRTSYSKLLERANEFVLEKRGVEEGRKLRSDSFGIVLSNAGWPEVGSRNVGKLDMPLNTPKSVGKHERRQPQGFHVSCRNNRRTTSRLRAPANPSGLQRAPTRPSSVADIRARMASSALITQPLLDDGPMSPSSSSSGSEWSVPPRQVSQNDWSKSPTGNAEWFEPTVSHSFESRVLTGGGASLHSRSSLSSYAPSSPVPTIKEKTSSYFGLPSPAELLSVQIASTTQSKNTTTKAILSGIRRSTSVDQVVLTTKRESKTSSDTSSIELDLGSIPRRNRPSHSTISSFHHSWDSNQAGIWGLNLPLNELPQRQSSSDLVASKKRTSSRMMRSRSAHDRLNNCRSLAQQRMGASQRISPPRISRQEMDELRGKIVDKEEKVTYYNSSNSSHIRRRSPSMDATFDRPTQLPDKSYSTDTTMSPDEDQPVSNRRRQRAQSIVKDERRLPTKSSTIDDISAVSHGSSKVSKSLASELPLSSLTGKKKNMGKKKRRSTNRVNRKLIVQKLGSDSKHAQTATGSELPRGFEYEEETMGKWLESQKVKNDSFNFLETVLSGHRRAKLQQ